LDPHKRTVRVRPNDNLPEFLRCLQSSLGAHGISEFLSTWNWFAADLAGGIHRVLLLHCGDDVRHSDSELRQLVRLDPQAHGVLTSAENLHIPNSRHACQWECADFRRWSKICTFPIPGTRVSGSKRLM